MITEVMSMTLFRSNGLNQLVSLGINRAANRKDKKAEIQNVKSKDLLFKRNKDT